MRTGVWRMAWELMTPRERMMAGVVFLVATVGAGAQVLMIGAIMPFLQVLSDPSRIGESDVHSWAYDFFGFDSSYRYVFWLGMLTIVVVVIANAIQVMKSYAVHRFAFRRMHSISIRLARSYLGREYEYFLDKNSGDISKRILAEANTISTFFLRPAANLVASGLATLFIIVFLLFVNPVVTIVGGGLVFLIYGVLHGLLKGRVRSIGKARVAANRDRFTSIAESMGGIKDIKILGKEAVFFRRFEDASKRLTDAEITSNIISEAPRFGIQAVFFSGVVIMCLFMIDAEMFNGDVSSISEVIPVLGVFALAGQRLIPEAQKVYASISKILYGTPSVESVHSDMEFGRSSLSLPADGKTLREGVFLEGVSYTYPGAEAPSLVDVNLCIPKGQRIGLVGGTGSGKTTLADICLGLLPPTEGRLRVDSDIIDDRSDRMRWRSRVGYIPQDIFIAEGSFAENIAFGVEPGDMDMEKVKRCARAARLHDVIMAHGVEGYDARVGERGIRLSGGQRQRLGIARALYRGAEFLVMDEATSALDTATEREVMGAIEALPETMTVIIIAHRLSTIRPCDRIVVLDGGCVVEQGNWETLVRRGVIFPQLVDADEGR